MLGSSTLRALDRGEPLQSLSLAAFRRHLPSPSIPLPPTMVPPPTSRAFGGPTGQRGILACVRHLEALKQHDLDLPNVPHVCLFIHRISPKTRSVAELEDPGVLGDATPAVQSHTPAVPRGRTECEGSIGKGMRPIRGSLRPGSPGPGPEVLYPGERNHPLKEQVPV